MAAHSVTNHSDENFHNWHLELKDQMRHPLAFHAEMMIDIMYYHQAIKQYVHGHIKAKRRTLIKRTEVCASTDVIPSVWAMQHKQNLTTKEVTKHKARLNIHRRKQQFGMNYFYTYAQFAI